IYYIGHISIAVLSLLSSCCGMFGNAVKNTWVTYMEELKGKVALVTGSTSGIGFAVANALAEAGANVIINGLLATGEAETLCKEIADRYQVEATFEPCDLRDPVQIAQMISSIESRYGALDILVNNAGIQH